MRFNVFFGVVALVCPLFASPCFAQEEVLPTFREPLYFSDIDRENRSPQAVRVGGVVFVSAISGPGASVEQQARTAYMRLQSILGNYGLTMADVAQERIYLKDGAPSEALRELRPLFYGKDAGPALTSVKVAGFENASTLVAIELIAVASPDLE